MLSNHGIKPKKSLGQNFLTSREVVWDIVDSIPFEKPVVAVEVGPGTGMLTKELAGRFEKVIAFEIDESLKDTLEELMEEYPNVEVRYGDFLKVDLEKEIEVGEDKELVFVANLPYYVTTPILFKVLESSIPFTSITVMMQKEVGDRFLAKVNDPSYNDLSVVSQYLCDIRKVRFVSKKDFYPVPKVDSIVLQMVKKKENEYPVNDKKQFFQMIREMFAYRRKTLLNNVTLMEEDKDKARQWLEKANMDGSKRPQECTIEEFYRMYKVKYD